MVERGVSTAVGTKGPEAPSHDALTSLAADGGRWASSDVVNNALRREGTVASGGDNDAGNWPMNMPAVMRCIADATADDSTC